MSVSTGLLAKYSGLIHITSPKSPFRIRRFNLTRLESNKIQCMPGNISGIGVRRSISERTHIKCAASSGRNHREARFEDEFRMEPFWVALTKETIWGLRSLIVFLCEQPGQLKYIEWPSFQSTLKTATLTLVLVALLIVALSSVDSALCYLLALLLRKTS